MLRSFIEVAIRSCSVRVQTLAMLKTFQGIASAEIKATESGLVLGIGGSEPFRSQDEIDEFVAALQVLTGLELEEVKP